MATYGSYKRLYTEAIQDATLTANEIAGNAVTQGKIAGTTITGTQIGTGQVTAAKLANNAVGTNQLASTIDLSTKTVTYRPIVNADISSSAAIATTKLSGAISSIASNGLATSATTDTTNASNITSGTLAQPYGGRGAMNYGFSVAPTSVNGSRGTITWAANQCPGGYVTGNSSNTFDWSGTTVTVYQPGLYITMAEVITSAGSNENDIFYYWNGNVISDFRGGGNNGNHTAVSGAIILNLSANDTVFIQTNTWHSGYYSRWSFHKLGGWA
jgi:hypothetical protein